VQILVPAEAAGILFTAHPITGQRDQALVNAAWGLGEAIVGGLVTPDTYTVEKATGRVLAREIAEKQVMTVRRNGGTHEQAVPESRRSVPVLDEAHLAELARLGLRIEALYGRPMDIEWALAEDGFHILQARPITALPEAAPAVQAAPTIQAAPFPEEGTALNPADWPLPDPKGIYLRGSIIDFMPNPLTPLFGSLIIPLESSSMKNLMVRITGGELDIFSNYLVVINGFPYLSGRYTPRQILQMIARFTPKIGWFIRNAISLWQDEARPRYQKIVAGWRAREPGGLSNRELLAGVDELASAAVEHLTVLQVATLGTAGGSEGLFTAVYDKLVKRAGDPPAPTFLLGLNSQPIQAEKALYDLGRWCSTQPGLLSYLRETPAAEIVTCLNAGAIPGEVEPALWTAWQQRFQAHLEQYGAAIYDLDFSLPLPMDEPAPLIETLKLYLSGQGKDPYARQQAMAGGREAAIQAVQGRLKGLKAWAFRKTLGWAHRTLPLREDSIAEIGLAYPVLRRLLAELGRRLAEAGVLATAGEIYWIEHPELETSVAALERGEQLPDLSGAVARRKAEWQARRRLTPPHQLPPNKKYMGMDTGALLGVHSNEPGGDTIRGLGASPGQVTAVARVLSGPEDFDQMRPGDVLVASITTPAWTPLFAMASAVVTDIGGILSHGSIVAREYGIPAVLGTGVATRRIRSGQVVRVDGSKGTITLL
jgi:pyruvate,water dikinase